MNRRVFSTAMIFRYIICSCLLVSLAAGQRSVSDFESEINTQSSTIETLKKEIERTRSRIANEQRKEKSAVERLSALEKEISLLNRLIVELKREKNSLKTQIDLFEKEITSKENELEDLRKRYEKRVIQAYKQGSLGTLEKVFSSTTWRQAAYRTHYLGIISAEERKIRSRIKTLLIDIGQKKISREMAMRKNESVQKDHAKQLSAYRNSKIRKEQELGKIRKNKSDLANYMQEKKKGLQELEELRKKTLEDKARFEREERIRRQQAALRSKSFAQLKGQLPWPAKGRVIAKFGRQWNQKLKTSTENPGIDIKGQPGSEIKTVLNGVITTITFIRGYGTTIIIDHGGGYYTVYSHVTNITTSIDSEVKSGDVIAYMGDNGSVNGSKLHFEIWGEGRKLNPEAWLQKQ